MEPVRAASIGLGWWGRALAQAAVRSGSLDITRCFARSPEKRQAFAEEHRCKPADTLEDVLADHEVDAVIVATPHSTHRRLVEAAAAADKHVFVEKPLTLTVEDGLTCVDAAGEAGVVLQVGHHRRRQPGNRRLHDLVSHGELGVVHQLEATMHVPKYQTPAPGWRSDPAESPAGGMTGLGVHMLDTFHYLVGPVARVMASSKRILGRWAVDDATAIVLEFESGPLGYLGTSLVVPRRCDVAVFGTEGIAWSEEEGTRLYRQGKQHTTRTEEHLEAVDELADELEEFACCVRTDGTPETGGPEALNVVAVLEAIVASIGSGTSVDVAHVRAS